MADSNRKVVLTNLANWTLTFKRINSLGDVIIPPKGKINMFADEVMAQIYNNNRLFVGEDGKGSHARILIEDEDLRAEAGFEDKASKSKQDILTDDKLKSLFAIGTISYFKKQVQKEVKSQAEKARIVDYAKANKINDHDKIEFLVKYTGFKIEDM